MPIAKLSASEAIDSLKSNPNGSWPKRGNPNRLTRLAKPAFNASFHLSEGATVFTIGSCFARNVERVLQEHGFHLPALDVLKNDPEFENIGSRAINNYGAPSICNELKWAFEDETDEDACFYQMGNGWVDLHMHNTMPPAPLEDVRARRTALRAAYRSIETCDAVVITLGLSEVWFDTQTGYYLNMAPRRSMLRENPDRFELHVLSYEETIQNLREACNLIREKGRDGIQIIVTVSPVPIQATYRDADVMVANTYSKSVLRAAAEEITQTCDFAHYFPSFESITLSDREAAYLDDEIHVTQEVVDLNISRMIEAYTSAEPEVTLEDIKAQLDLFRVRPKIGYEQLSAHPQFFKDAEVAMVFVEAATSVGEFDEALAVLAYTNDPSGILTAQLQMVQGRPKTALASIKARPSDGRHLSRYFGLRVQANALLGEYDAAVDAAQEWSSTAPNSPTPFRLLARSLAASGDTRAEDWFARAVDVSGGKTALVLDMADYLVKSGKGAEAQVRLAKITQASDKEQRRKSQLLAAV